MTLHQKIKIILNYENYSPEERADALFLLHLSAQQQQIFVAILNGEGNARSCMDIFKLSGIETKNISSIINDLSKKYPIKSIGPLRRKKYYK